MANFSVDQVRQLYVIPNGVQILTNNTSLADTADNGALSLRFNAATGAASDKSFYFEYKSPNAGIVRSDLIDRNKITYVKGSVATDKPYQRQEIALDPSINSGAPVIGEKYIFRVRFYGMGVGGNDIQYVKVGGVYTARTGDTAETIFKAIVDLFNKGIEKEPEQWVSINVTGAGNAAKIVIESVERPFRLGQKDGSPMRFECSVTTVSYYNQDIPWGIVTDTTFTNPNKYSNARVTADMEWFYLGERTVQDRLYSYPNNFDLEYLAKFKPIAVPGAGTIRYDFIDLEFFYSGDTEDVQRSKKQLTLAIERAPGNAPTGPADYNRSEIATILAAFNGLASNR